MTSSASTGTDVSPEEHLPEVAHVEQARVGLVDAHPGRFQEQAVQAFVGLPDHQVLDLKPRGLVGLVAAEALGMPVDQVVVRLGDTRLPESHAAIGSATMANAGAAVFLAAQAARDKAISLALPKSRILLRHLLPNCMPPLIVIATVQIARAITLEATLSFLGLGLPITEPSLGLLIANGFEYLMSGKYWISFFPGLALLVTIVSINLIGDHLRDVLNPRLRR